jgi:hypothetical protein
VSTLHLLDSEGAVVCTATASSDGSNVTSNAELVTCEDGCLGSWAYRDALTRAAGQPVCSDCGGKDGAHYLSCLTYLAWVHRYHPDNNKNIASMRAHGKGTGRKVTA